MGVGMPQFIYLNEFGNQVKQVFGDYPFHVGSSLTNKNKWRDVDVRLILSDEDYEKLNLGDPEFPHCNKKWCILCSAFSELGRKLTGLPIDFQIQQMTIANKLYTGRRSAIGLSVDIR